VVVALFNSMIIAMYSVVDGEGARIAGVVYTSGRSAGPARLGSTRRLAGG
jgi:hypothetical protein